MLGGNQTERKSNAGRLWAAVFGVVFFGLALTLTNSLIGRSSDVASWGWTVFVPTAIAAAMGIALAVVGPMLVFVRKPRS